MPGPKLCKQSPTTVLRSGRQAEPSPAPILRLGQLRPVAAPTMSMPAEPRKTARPIKTKRPTPAAVLSGGAILAAKDSTSGQGAASALEILRRRQQSRDQLKIADEGPSRK